MTWVKFHGELRSGAKRGLPRAVRFVFLELSHEARSGNGTIALPVGMSDLDAMHDILGGNAKEVREAHRLLTEGPDPMVVFDGPAGARRLTIPAWGRWNAGVKEPAGASTQRSQRKRATGDDEAGNGDATVVQRALQGKATGDETACNARSSEEESREEESREDPPVVPQGGPTGDVGLVWAAYVEAHARALGRRGPQLSPTAARRELIRRRLKDYPASVLVSACRGVFADPWCLEHRKVELEWVLRNAGQVEKFAGLDPTASEVPDVPNEPPPPPPNPRLKGMAPVGPVGDLGALFGSFGLGGAKSASPLAEATHQAEEDQKSQEGHPAAKQRGAA